jgi:hypothetical protein
VHVFALQQQAITRHDIAGFEQRNVARNDFLQPDVLRVPAAANRGARVHQRLQLLHGPAGPVFLPKTHGPREEQDAENQRSITVLPQRRGKHHREDQQEHQRRTELSEE